MIFDLSPRLRCLPIVHGSGDAALEVVRRLQAESCDCLAVPLPPSFAEAVEEGIGQLPRIGAVLQAERGLEGAHNYVPIDPCQGVIAALRYALGQNVDRAYIDWEVGEYEERGVHLPDPYALKAVSLERFAATLLPALPEPEPDSQALGRVRRMAYELHCLELDYQHIVCVCSVADWPWLRQAYQQRTDYPAQETPPDLPRYRPLVEASLYFLLGELPYITSLYEHRRAELLGATSQGVDGVKALLLDARRLWLEKEQPVRNWATPQRLDALLRYVRNLAVMDRRLTPDLYHLVVAAQQVVGDGFALALVEKAREYPPQRLPIEQEAVHFGLDEFSFDDGATYPVKNRLPGPPRTWRHIELKPEPPAPERAQWRHQWDPGMQCSYPPEDMRIEQFQQHVREQARAAISEERGRSEPFAASLKDGLDIRETLRNWHTGRIYVRELPPGRGQVEIVVFLFDTPADPGRYSWCSTWFAEHEEESTLAYYATPFEQNMVGPGIGQALYGGCSFTFPPRPFPDIWQDQRFAFATTLEERLLAGALYHSREKRVVLVAPTPPLPAWRRLAKGYGKQLVHVPLARFSAPLVDRLRHFHVLNSRSVRSYAARYIRDFR